MLWQAATTIFSPLFIHLLSHLALLAILALTLNQIYHAVRTVSLFILFSVALLLFYLELPITLSLFVSSFLWFLFFFYFIQFPSYLLSYDSGVIWVMTSDLFDPLLEDLFQLIDAFFLERPEVDLTNSDPGGCHSSQKNTKKNSDSHGFTPSRVADIYTTLPMLSHDFLVD